MVRGAGKTEDGLVQYNEEVNKLGDDLRELYETIRVNVDEEEQWKVFDFVEDFFMEELEIGDYINDINSYHLHMFDKHDVTTKKFDAIVEKVGKVEANYAAQIEGYCSLLVEYGKKFETVCAMLALDLIGVIPVIGALKYSDEIGTLFKNADKVSVVARSTDGTGVLAIEGGKAVSFTQKNVGAPILPEGSQWERNVLNSFAGGKATQTTYEGGTVLYRVGGKNGGFWSLEAPPMTEYQWRVDYAIKQPAMLAGELWRRFLIW